MSPLRLILLGLLGYLLYRLLFNPRPQGPGAGLKEKKRGGHGAAADVLVEDPVCHVYVPRRQALQIQDDAGGMHYFCSNSCRDRYLDTMQGDQK